MERPRATGRGKPAGRWGSQVFLRCVGAADYCAGRTRRDHPPCVGRRRPPDPDHLADRCHPCLVLQRLRPDHRRTR
nr:MULTISPECIES: hypothetical protein [unclassified Pseudomonas]